MPFFYFPMQNFEKIVPSTSGSTLCPVILPNAATAVRRSTAASSHDSSPILSTARDTAAFASSSNAAWRAATATSSWFS